MTSDYSVYSRKGGVDMYFHTFVMWASDWGWIEHTLDSRRSPPETEVFLSFYLSIGNLHHLSHAYLIRGDNRQAQMSTRCGKSISSTLTTRYNHDCSRDTFNKKAQR